MFKSFVADILVFIRVINFGKYLGVLFGVYVFVNDEETLITSHFNNIRGNLVFRRFLEAQLLCIIR